MRAVNVFSAQDPKQLYIDYRINKVLANPFSPSGRRCRNRVGLGRARSLLSLDAQVEPQLARLGQVVDDAVVPPPHCTEGELGLVRQDGARGWGRTDGVNLELRAVRLQGGKQVSARRA